MSRHDTRTSLCQRHRERDCQFAKFVAVESFCSLTAATVVDYREECGHTGDRSCPHCVTVPVLMHEGLYCTPLPTELWGSNVYLKMMLIAGQTIFKASS